MKKSTVAGNKELRAEFCPECGEKVTDGFSVCEKHKSLDRDVWTRTLKYHCRVCDSPTANRDKYCRYCGLEH